MQTTQAPSFFRPRVLVATALAALVTAMFVGLGIWQIERLQWKLDLIARVDARVHADAVPAPAEDAWASVTREGDEYRHVSVTGTFVNADEVQIYVPTRLGPGYWVMTPLKRDDGTYVMINRGFVPEELKDPAKRTPPTGAVTVKGLLRISEDKGWLFSRANDPEHKAWYRRDIGSITKAFDLAPAAPYFIDEELGSDPDAFPRGGLTVVEFRNSHLSYAITWFAMALMTLVCYGVVLRQWGLLGGRKAAADD
ncbi:SURF1 family protein [Rhizobium halophytocola]|uniref:SURF1-like protein n=1 Tax=Rhizobium halophytocola TaxID=735519 RepID=A0ABS4DWW8_9HYPH|nr:SURF1 family protein [Rhizobium halophytocola]MBP1850191.1 surfeit locus 1 family protein [Rhizobium halophytocola]